MHPRDILWNMDTALKSACTAFDLNEVPVGCIIVDADGSEIANAHNLKETTFDPTGHAEIHALRLAASNTKAWRLTGATLFVTLEPCPMCLAAMVQARIKRCIFGAYDKKGGALSLGYYLHQDRRLNHQLSMMGGVRHWECSQLLSRFFRLRREQYKSQS
jgi:tRNA(adenine34) deaminase